MQAGRLHAATGGGVPGKPRSQGHPTVHTSTLSLLSTPRDNQAVLQPRRAHSGMLESSSVPSRVLCALVSRCGVWCSLSTYLALHTQPPPHFHTLFPSIHEHATLSTLPHPPSRPRQINVRCVHDLSTYAWNNAVVFSNGAGQQLVLDHHGLFPYGTLWSNIYVGDREWECCLGVVMRGHGAGSGSWCWTTMGCFPTALCGATSMWGIVSGSAVAHRGGKGRGAGVSSGCQYKMKGSLCLSVEERTWGVVGAVSSLPLPTPHPSIVPACSPPSVHECRGAWLGHERRISVHLLQFAWRQVKGAELRSRGYSCWVGACREEEGGT